LHAAPPVAHHPATLSEHLSTDGDAVDLLLVRHGETVAYTSDAGLTEQGVEQSRSWGRELAAGAAADRQVTLLTGPARRARETAEHVHWGLTEGTRAVAEPRTLAELHNFRIRTPSGLLEITEAYPTYEAAAAAVDGGPRPLWLREFDVFWERQVSGDDPITLWMRVPLLTFEPPPAVVRRLLDAIVQLVPAAGPTLYVCCTHSGPMRALAAWALGRDLGEPRHTEVVRARVRRDLSVGWITYRGVTQPFGPTSSRDGDAGWETADRQGR
jgi:broad specificity phosphatase PhoE